MKTTRIFAAFTLVIAILQGCEVARTNLPDNTIDLLTSDVWFADSTHGNSASPEMMLLLVHHPGNTNDGNYYLFAGEKLFKNLAGQWRLSKDRSRIIFDNVRGFEVTVTAQNLMLTSSDAESDKEIIVSLKRRPNADTNERPESL